MRSAMNRFKLLSGGIATSMMVLAASAVAQGPGEWTMTGRTYDLQRYSPLTQINKANVKSLKASWTFSTGVLNGHEGNPLVIGTVMYVHSAFPNIVFALDLTKEGAPMIWKHVPAQPPEAKPIACCDLVNRGLAYHPSGKLFIELLAGDLLALDAKTGKQIWRVPNADYKTGSTMTNAPIVIKDIVIAGISGGEFGVRGRVTAYDVNSGKEVWRAYSTGPDADVKIVGDANPNYASHRGKDLGVSTWQGDAWSRGGPPGSEPAVRDHVEEEHRGHLPGRHRIQGSAAISFLSADQALLRPHEQHLHGLRGRRGEVLRRSAVRRRDRAHVPGPGR